MSKLQFRARALDNQKPMAVHLADVLADLSEMTSMNRTVPQMPTGMEKEEESEHHLQRAISAQQVYGDASRLVIPTPEAKRESSINYGDVYTNNVKPPKQLIHMQALGLDEDVPDYDMDSEDEEWVVGQSKSQPLTSHQFEGMMDTLEKGSGNQALSLREAQALLRADDDVVIAVYDYWLAKRLRLKRPLIPAVKNERRDGSTANDPYVAFRRRTERMQTRKNRKNDESSYEKMLKLRRDIARALSLLEMVKIREKTKRELMSTTLSVVEKRYELQDWNGQLYSQYIEQHRIRAPRPAPPIPIPQPQAITTPTTPAIHPRRILEGRLTRDHDDLWTEEQERHFRPSLHRNLSNRRRSKSHRRRHSGHIALGVNEVSRGAGMSDTEEMLPQSELMGDMEEMEVEGPFPFRRRKLVQYRQYRDHCGVWPWEDPVRHCSNVSNPRYRFSCLSINKRFVGFTRRRLGRGGRVWIDRTSLPNNMTTPELESSLAEQTLHLERRVSALSEKEQSDLWPHYLSRPTSLHERLRLFHTACEAINQAQAHKDNQDQSLVDINYFQEPTFNVYPSASEDNDIGFEHKWQQSSSAFDSQPISRFSLLSCDSAAERLVSRVAEDENMKEIGFHEQPVVNESLELTKSLQERNALFRSLDKPRDQPPADLFEDCLEKEEEPVVLNGPASDVSVSVQRDGKLLGLCLPEAWQHGVRERGNVGSHKRDLLKGTSFVESVNDLLLMGEDRLEDIGSNRRQNSLLSGTVSPLEQQPMMS